MSHFARYQEVLEKYAFSDPMKGRCVVAVEVPGGYVHEKCRGPELLETAFQAGRIFSAAQALGVRCFRATADEVRRALYGKRSGKLMKADAAVAAALPLFILGLPKRTNVHVRDSLAVAHAATLVMS